VLHAYERDFDRFGYPRAIASCGLPCGRLRPLEFSKCLRGIVKRFAAIQDA